MQHALVSYFLRKLDCSLARLSNLNSDSMYMQWLVGYFSAFYQIQHSLGQTIHSTDMVLGPLVNGP